MVKALSLAQNMAWNTFGCLTYQACQWLLTVFAVTLSSDYANSGYLAFAMAVGNLFLGLATYNMRTFQVSDVNNQYSSNNYIGFRFVTLTVASIAFVAYVAFISEGMMRVATLVYLAFKVDESFVNVMYGIDQKAQRMDYIGKSQLLRGAGCLAGFCAGLALFGNILISLFSMFAICLLITIMFDLPHSGKIASLKPVLSRKLCFELARVCFPSAASVFLCGVVVSVVRQAFGLQYGDEALGIYAAIATPAVVVQVLASYLYNPVLAPLSTLWFERKKKQFVSFLLKTLGFMIALIVFVIVAFALVGDWLLVMIYGSSIAPYTFLLVPVLVSTGQVALMWFLTDVLISLRALKSALFSNVCAVVVSLVTMNWFMHNWYMNGINLCIITSYCVSIAVGSVLLFRVVSKQPSSDSSLSKGV